MSLWLLLSRDYHKLLSWTWSCSWAKSAWRHRTVENWWRVNFIQEVFVNFLLYNLVKLITNQHLLSSYNHVARAVATRESLGIWFWLLTAGRFPNSGTQRANEFGPQYLSALAVMKYTLQYCAVVIFSGKRQEFTRLPVHTFVPETILMQLTTVWWYNNIQSIVGSIRLRILVLLSKSRSVSTSFHDKSFNKLTTHSAKQRH